MNSNKTRYNLTHYLLGALPARLGDEMSGQALLLLGLAITHTIALGSALLACLTLSAAVGGPLLGAVLDRSPKPGSILAGALGLYAAGLICIALFLGRIPAWVTLTTALAAGFCMPAISGGWSSRLKTFIADEHMVRASAIDATTFNVAGLAGPALAGLIAAALGARWAVAVLVALLVAALPMAWLLPHHIRPAAILPRESFWCDVRAGFLAIATNNALLRITLVSVVSYLGIGMLWVACPLVGRDVFGNVGYGGVLMSVLSVGALAATLAYAKWPPRYSPDIVAFAATILLAVALLALAFAHTIVLALGAMLLAGLADGPQLAAVFAVRHREAPVRSRSQVFTTGASLKITAAAIGAALAGRLAGQSLKLTILAACAAQLLAAAVFVLMAGRTNAPGAAAAR